MLERFVTYYIEAERKEDICDFLDAHPDWKPGDVPGLIDVVGDELETDYGVQLENGVTANFRVTPALELKEIE